MNGCGTKSEGPEPDAKTETWRSGEGTPARSILFIGACASPDATALCEAVARPGDRIAIQHDGDFETAARVAARVAARGALAFPLEANPASGPAAARVLVERVVEDFARIDLVVHILSGMGFQVAELPSDVHLVHTVRPVHSPPEDHAQDARATALRSWAEACEPVLRRARPAGRFLVVVFRNEDAELAQIALRTVETVAAEWVARKSRARVEAFEIGAGPADAAQFAASLAAFVDRLVGR